MARRLPARHRSGPKKGQFKKSGRRNPAPGKSAKTYQRSRRKYRYPAGRRAAAKRALSRAPARRAPRSVARRRRSRANEPKYINRAMIQIAAWAAGATLGQRLLNKSGVLSGLGAFGAFVPVIAVGGLGVMMARKVKSRPIGYALIGIAAGQLASVAFSMWMPQVGGVSNDGNWAARSSIKQRLPMRVRAPQASPVASIVVPA